MRPDIHILLSGCLTFGLPLLFAIRELLILRRDDNGDGPQRRPDPEVPPKPLPPCLLVAFQPRPVPQRPEVRQPELV